jgi:hypothetical protein
MIFEYKQEASTMAFRVVTNNPTVRLAYPDVVFIEGSYEEVLVKVRDLVHSGVELIDHPLGASIRMLLSPFRSIMVGTEPRGMNTEQILIIEQSIMTYRTLTQRRKPEPDHAEDYAVIDAELLKASIQAYEDIMYQGNTQLTGGEFFETRA